MSRRDSKIKFLKKYQSKPFFLYVEKFKNQEILPIVKFLKNPNTDNSIKLSLKKYLIIASVSLIERSLTRLASKIIDDQKIDIKTVFNEKNFNSKYSTYLHSHPGSTKGQFYLADSNISFQNTQTINDIFTKILKTDSDFDKLGIDSFDAIKKIEWYDPFKNIDRAIALDKNWRNFIKMFDRRQEIIHEMTKLRTSDNQIYSFCDNSINFIDNLLFISIKDYRKEVIDRLKSNYTLREINKAIGP
jgi:hypothetical protein